MELADTSQAKRAQRTADELRDEAEALLLSLRDRSRHDEVERKLHALHRSQETKLDLAQQVEVLQHIVAQQQRRQGLLSTDG